MNRLFLDALAGKNRGRAPVWLMRQAGRYMPDYRALREKHSLTEMFHSPELAAQVTLLPIDLLGVDAAILFSDILLIAESLGLKILYPEGSSPVLEKPLTSPSEIDQLTLFPAREKLGYVERSIQILKPQLQVPLIGFCGGPFTVASYFVEKQGKGELSGIKKWIYHHPDALHKLLQLITDATIDSLKMQIEAGANVVQLFDSWAGVLPLPLFKTFSLHYLEKIVEALRPTQIPVILFCRGSALFASELATLNPAAISFDWQLDMAEIRKRVPSHIAVQGNLDPDLLRAPPAVIKSTAESLLNSMRNEPGFILNLGHGVLPDTPIDNARLLVATATSR
jgi:uroporphyrinogen decarboxylase